MTRVRELGDPSTGKAWGTRCNGDVVEIRAGAPGAGRHGSKPQADAEAAVAYAMKQEWARLKKGFVLSVPDAPAGQPRMHRYLGRGGFTGAMAVEAVDGGLLCNRYDLPQRLDRLVLVDPSARITDSIHLPEGALAWQARYVPAVRAVLVKADHRVLSYPLPLADPAQLTAHNLRPASFLSAEGTRAAWYAEPDIVVSDLESGAELFRRPAVAHMYGGHSPQMEGALSPDGAVLACSARPGEVELYDVHSGRRTATWSGDFALIGKLLFTPDSRRLFAREEYGSWRWRCFDLAELRECTDFPGWHSARSDLAIDAHGGRAALAQGGEVRVLDLATLRCSLRFAVDHVVKRCAVTWVDGAVGVLTDYGCASLYAVDSTSGPQPGRLPGTLA